MGESPTSSMPGSVSVPVGGCGIRSAPAGGGGRVPSLWSGSGSVSDLVEADVCAPEHQRTDKHHGKEQRGVHNDVVRARDAGGDAQAVLSDTRQGRIEGAGVP